MNYKRKDLVESTLVVADLDRDDIIFEVLDFISKLKEGDRLEIRGFGSFVRKRSTTVNRRNPYNGQSVGAGTFTTIRFKPSKMLRGK